MSSKIPNFISSDLLAPVLSHLPDTPLHRKGAESLPTFMSRVGNLSMDVAAPIVQKLLQFGQEIYEFRRRHALAFDTLHETLADDNDLVEWKLKDLVPKVFGIPASELSDAGLLALDRFAASNEHGIHSSRLVVDLKSFWVQSRQHVRMQNQVIQWGRMYQESAARAALGEDIREELRKNPLNAFINIAHRLILKSRKIRSPTTIGTLGPSAEGGHHGVVRAVDTGQMLTKNDKLILRFIFDVSQMSPALVRDEARSICALIYRAIGAYPNLNLGRKVSHLLVQELGLIPPWHDRGRNTYQRRLPGLGIWPYQERLVAAAEASCNSLEGFQDSVRHLRKDWGQMPVYCIDARDALDIDDGISVERVPDTPDHVWIHVHIANPAAYISPEHPIAAAAKDIFCTTYTPSKRFNMMPPKFAQNLASLAANRPVITVSSLVRDDGSTVDIKMSLGIIRNVVRLTHAAVGHAFDGTHREQATMVIGGERPAPEDDGEDSEVLAEALPDLLLMRQFLDQRYLKRFSDWPEEERVRRTNSMIRSSVWTSLCEESVALFTPKLQHWKGDPIIAIEADRFPGLFGDFENTPFVEHAMLLAGESAARWCKDRKIPILFHVATPHPSFPVSKLNQLQEGDQKIGPAGRISSTPDPHWILNMWQYTRITSPIRRYPDLVNQWQIQTYLEAVSGVSQDGRDASSQDPLEKLPFTPREIEDSAAPFNATAILLRRASCIATEHWIHQAFFRAFHFKEAELPEVWDLKIVGSGKHMLKVAGSTGISGYLSPFPARAELLSSAEKWEKDAKRFQYIPVKIETVDAEQERILVRAVGPVSDRPTTTQPIHIQSPKRSPPSE